MIADLLHDNKNYDHQQIVEHVLCRAIRGTPNVPVFKYLRSIGINSLEDDKELNLNLDKIVKRDLKNFQVKAHSRAFLRSYDNLNIENIIKSCTAENASAYIPFLPKEKVDLDKLRDFLIQNQEKVDYKVSSYASNHCTEQKIKIADIVDKYDALAPLTHSRAASGSRAAPLACLVDLRGCFESDQIHSEKHSWLGVYVFLYESVSDH